MTKQLLKVAAVVVVCACIGAAANHEKLGDRAYADQQWRDALVEYRLALVRRAPDAGLRAKAGAAALHAGDLLAAAEEYVALAQEGGDSTEAADGLVRVADAAIDGGARDALTAAVNGLQEVAPGRALGSFAQQLAGALGSVPRSAEALSVLTFAAAGAPDARTQDSLMYVHGVVLRRLGRCEEAVVTFEGLVRRARVPEVVLVAREELALCALSLGHAALELGEPSRAERWFTQAAQQGGDSPSARAAYIGLGDVRLAQADFLGAAEAYERARLGITAADSIYRIASRRLNLISRVQIDPDSG